MIPKGTPAPHSWDARFLDLASHIAGWSKHRTTKVGCVVVDDERRIRSTGFNGFPRGVDDLPERLLHRPTKLLLSVHAEANAVASAARAGVPLAGCTAYVTHPPCSQCAALLAQAGIRRVVYRGQLREDWAESEAAARTIFLEAGIASERHGEAPMDDPPLEAGAVEAAPAGPQS